MIDELDFGGETVTRSDSCPATGGGGGRGGAGWSCFKGLPFFHAHIYDSRIFSTQDRQQLLDKQHGRPNINVHGQVVFLSAEISRWKWRRPHCSIIDENVDLVHAQAP